MQTKYMQVLAALRQAQTFLNANNAALGTINTSGARQALDASITQFAASAEAQEGHRIQGTGARASQLRLAATLLRQNVRPIVAIAKAKAETVPELSEVKALKGRINPTELVERARGTLTAVMPYAQAFIDAGLPADFIDRLNAAANKLLEAVATKGDHKAKRQKSTEAITQQVSVARRAVNMVDSLVKAQLAESEPLVTEWQSAIRVIRGGHPAPASPSTPPAVAAPATTASA